jgi:hypothetical protein
MAKVSYKITVETSNDVKVLETFERCSNMLNRLNDSDMPNGERIFLFKSFVDEIEMFSSVKDNRVMLGLNVL